MLTADSARTATNAFTFVRRIYALTFLAQLHLARLLYISKRPSYFVPRLRSKKLIIMLKASRDSGTSAL